MTKSEARFRKEIKTLVPSAFLHKIQDYKAGGTIAQAGMPDYVLIYNSETIWYEVKYIDSAFICHYDFTIAQIRTFHKMLGQGAIIRLWVQRKASRYTYKVVTLDHDFLERMKNNERIRLFYNR